MIAHIDAIRDKSMTILTYDKMVFMGGNYQTQRLAGCYSDKPQHVKARLLAIKRHFIYSCLIADAVIQPVANYHQSKITQWLTDKFSVFFNPYKSYPATASYAVSYRKGTFIDDAKEKTSTYTDNYTCYKDPIIRDALTKHLKKLTDPFIRKGQLANSLSDIVLTTSNSDGQLFQFVQQLTDSSEDTKRILWPLREICKEQKLALIPEYLKMKIKEKTPPSFFKLMRLALLEAYTQIVGELYNAYPHNPLYPFMEFIFPYKLHYLDTHLFQFFLRLTPEIEDIIVQGKPEQILELKYSPRFDHFLQYYKEFVEQLRASTMNEYKRLVLRDYEKQKAIYCSRVSQLMENPRLLKLLHCSLQETLEKRQIIQTKDIMSYAEIPIFSLVSEVMERFTKRYEHVLSSRLASKDFWKDGQAKAHIFCGPESGAMISQSLQGVNVEGDLKLCATINIENVNKGQDSRSIQKVEDVSVGDGIQQIAHSEDTYQSVVKSTSNKDIVQVVDESCVVSKKGQAHGKDNTED